MKVFAVIWNILTLVALSVADFTITLLLRTRRNELRVKPTERINWRKGLKNELMKRQNRICTYCGYRRMATSMDIDHMIPVSRGGSNDKSNLQVICRRCNLRKGQMTDGEFRQRYAALGVPSTPMTPPNHRISQAEFSRETRNTEQPESLREFRSKRLITAREKIIGGAVGIGIGTFVIILFVLAPVGLEGMPLLLPPMLAGTAIGGGIFLRAQRIGALEDDY